MDMELGALLGQLYMDTAKVILASTAAAAAAVWWNLDKSKPQVLPPGPRGYPIVGNSLDYAGAVNENKLPEYTLSLHEKFGDIISVRVGSVLFVCIKDGELVKRLFGSEEFSERPVELMPMLKTLNGGDGGGICFNNGANHAEMRKLTLSTFRDLGVGKRTLDEMIQTECNHFSQFLEKASKENGGVIYDLKSKAQQVTANVIHNIVLGSRYEYNDEKWTEILNLFNVIFSVNIFGFPENFIPALRYLPFMSHLLTRQQMKDMYEANDKMKDYLREKINEHRESYVPGEIRDFVDLFVKNELEKSEQINMDNLFLVIVDVFRAGADSTASSLAWCIQYMVLHPEIQEEIRQEVDEVVGDQLFNKENKRSLVKLMAFVQEVQRYASIAPSTGPHTVRKATKVGDYTIPADSVVFGSLYSIHHDKKYWGDPEKFRISRWIDEKGELLKHEDHFFPFGTGKRVCIGRQLVSIELIIFLVHILQRFKFEKAPGYSDMRDEQQSGLLRSPNSYHVKVVCRD